MMNHPILTPVKKVLVTGATGFVGKHLLVALNQLGYETVGATRKPSALTQQQKNSATQWVQFDVDDASSIYEGLHEIDTAYYLVHRIKAGTNYMQSECDSASRFVEQAKKAGLKRIIYLGGVYPGKGRSSKHLESRVVTGEILRKSGIPTFELRAAMVIGHGSESWTIVRDLSRRLPLMVLPRWLRNISWPISIVDVVVALALSAEIPISQQGWYDLPGPRRISHQALLRKVAFTMGKRPSFIPVPVLSPKLSSYWINLVTHASKEIATELVEGLSVDLEPTGNLFGDLIGNYQTLSLGEAIQVALEEEHQQTSPSESLKKRIDERVNLTKINLEKSNLNKPFV